MIMIDQLMTVHEVAGRLRLSVEMVRRECRTGRMENIRVGGKGQFRITEDGLAEWVRRYAGRESA